MDKVIFTEEQLKLRRFNTTRFYQDVVFLKLQDAIIEKQFRLDRACKHLGEQWKTVKMYLSTTQKTALDELVTKYGRNGGARLRRISTRPAGNSPDGN